MRLRQQIGCSFILSLCAVLVLMAGCGGPKPPAGYVHYGMKGGSSAGVVQVRQGDNLYRLAERNQVPMQDLILANNLQPPYMLHQGQRLKLPAPRVYIARSGDSYSSIARQFELDITDLVRINNSRAPHNITVGQRVILSPSQAKPKQTATQKAQQQKITRAVAAQVPKQTYQAPPSATGKKAWPLQGNVISSFGPKEGGLYNDGINIGAPRGTPVRVAQNGVVAYAGNDLSGFGNLVLVRHDNGYVTAYAHLDQIFAERGAVLEKGASLGTVGSTGSVNTPQLHFEIRKNGKPVNPQNYLG